MAEKGHKRNNLLKRLSSTKWGATQDVPAYKTFVQWWNTEVVSLASNTGFAKCDVVQNNALRTITGGGKVNPIGLAGANGHRTFGKSKGQKHALKIWEKAKGADKNTKTYWQNYRPTTQRLKTHTSPITHAESLKEK